MKREPSAQKNDTWYQVLGVTRRYLALPPSLPGTIVVHGISSIAVPYLVPGTRY